MILSKKVVNITFYIATFVLLFSSFSVNLFNIASDHHLRFDRGDEGYVLGRIIASEIDGMFSHGGLPCNYVYYRYLPDENGNPVSTELWEAAEGKQENLRNLPHSRVQAQMYDDYVNDRKIADGWQDVYKTQPSMMANVYGALHIVLPISNVHKLQFFRIINLLLTTLAFVLILGWVKRKFGLVVGIIVFVLLFLSSWPIRFSGNLWWALWSFYIPFITMIFLLEKKHLNPSSISHSKVIFYLFIAMFIKFLFTGAEFITSTSVMAVCPIIFYTIENRYKVKDSFVLWLKYSLAAILGVLVGFVLLITQIRFYEGTWKAGIDHIVFSFTKRSVTGNLGDNPFWDVLRTYFTKDSIFLWDFAPQVSVNFGIVALVIALACCVLFFLNKGSKYGARNNALIITTIISIIGMLSWIIIFLEHAYTHPLFDYITWYMPFCIYGFVVIGVTINMMLQRMKEKETANLAD